MAQRAARRQRRGEVGAPRGDARPPATLATPRRAALWRLFSADALCGRLVVRGHVPSSIWSRGLSLAELRGAGLADAVAARVFKNPVLWLTRASPARIAKTHVADLRGRYHFGPSLSLLELRAVLAAVEPDAFDGNDTPRGDERAWRQQLEGKLREKL